MRVVLDFKDVKDHTIFYLQNPTRLVIDVRGAALPRVASSRPDRVRPDPIEPPDLPPQEPGARPSRSSPRFRARRRRRRAP